MNIKYKLTEDKEFEIDLPIDQARKERINKRVIKALRTADEAINAAKKAREQGKIKEADDLEADAAALKAWAEGQYDKTAEISDPNHFQNSPSSEDSNNKSSENASDPQDSTNNNTNDSEEDIDSSEEKTNTEQTDNNDNEGDDTWADSSDLSSDTNQDDSQLTDKSNATNSKADTDDSSDDNDTNNDSFDDEDDLDSEDAETNQEGKNSEDEADSEDEIDSENDAESEDDSESPESSKNKNKSNKTASQSDEDSSDDTEDDQSDSSSSSSKQVKNPFDIDPKQSKKSADNKPSGQAPSQDENDELEQMKQVLKMLRGGEKDGAKAALQDILNQRSEKANDKKEALHEKLNINKAIGSVSDDEFEDIINSVLDKVDVVNPITYSTPRAARVKEIKADVTNSRTIRDLSAEDKANLAKDIDPAEKARQDEIKKYRVDNLPSTNVFKLDLYDAIKDQVDRVKKATDSWGAINKHHANTDIIKPGTIIRGELEDKKPVIQVYLDCSGSFSERDIEKERALMNVLAEFEDNNEIETQIWYFADHLHDNYAAARNEGGTSAWNEIMDKIKKTNPANVLVVTDSDMEYQGRTCGYYNTDGCVWYIWKRSKAPSLPEHLYGNLGLKEYVIGW